MLLMDLPIENGGNIEFEDLYNEELKEHKLNMLFSNSIIEDKIKKIENDFNKLSNKLSKMNSKFKKYYKLEQPINENKYRIKYDNLLSNQYDDYTESIIEFKGNISKVFIEKEISKLIFIHN